MPKQENGIVTITVEEAAVVAAVNRLRDHAAGLDATAEETDESEAYNSLRAAALVARMQAESLELAIAAAPGHSH